MLIIGITGGTGSGKTTLVNQIVKQLPKAKICIISQDSYYKQTNHLSYEQRTEINFDHPDAIDFPLLVNHLKALKAGKTISQPVYSFIIHNRTEDTVKISPKRVVIVEGILIFNHKKLVDLFDIKIFVQADADERLIRRIKRDIAERGRSIAEVLYRYQHTLKPMHQQFIEPMKQQANLIIPNDKQNGVASYIIQTVINDHL